MTVFWSKKGFPYTENPGYSEILLTVTLFGRPNPAVTVSGEACTMSNILSSRPVILATNDYTGPLVTATSVGTTKKVPLYPECHSIRRFLVQDDSFWDKQGPDLRYLRRAIWRGGFFGIYG